MVRSLTAAGRCGSSNQSVVGYHSECEIFRLERFQKSCGRKVELVALRQVAPRPAAQRTRETVPPHPDRSGHWGLDLIDFPFARPFGAALASKKHVRVRIGLDSLGLACPGAVVNRREHRDV